MELKNEHPLPVSVKSCSPHGKVRTQCELPVASRNMSSGRVTNNLSLSLLLSGVV